MRAPLEVRFWAKVDKSGGPEACWPWTGCTNRWRGMSGYGLIQSGGKNLKAHRVAYELCVGSIPEGEGWHGVCVCHRCDNRLCCNPAHLFLGTNAENAKDKTAKGRNVSRLTGNGQIQQGELNHQAKLRDDDVRAIRGLAASGVKQDEIATRFGVSQSAISFIVLGRRWGHITGGSTNGSER